MRVKKFIFVVHTSTRLVGTNHPGENNSVFCTSSPHKFQFQQVPTTARSPQVVWIQTLSNLRNWTKDLSTLTSSAMRSDWELTLHICTLLLRKELVVVWSTHWSPGRRWTMRWGRTSCGVSVWCTLPGSYPGCLLSPRPSAGRGAVTWHAFLHWHHINQQPATSLPTIFNVQIH